jgi:fatty acid desaturase
LGLYFLGPWSLLLIVLVQQGFGGLYMASVFAPNHKGMLLVDADTELDFLRSQVLTARNVYSHPVTDFWYGGLNYQVEHHLFPTMPRNQLSKAHQMVADYCRELGIPIHDASMAQSYKELLSYLHEVSEPLRTPKAQPLQG